MNRRVVITGTSMITPLGIGRDKTWEALVEGRSATSRLTRLDPNRFNSSVSAEVRDFRAEDWIEPKPLRNMGRFTQFAVVAARMAWQDAGLEMSEEESLRSG